MLLSDAARSRALGFELAERVYRRRQPGIVLRGMWTCDPQEVTRGDLRRFLAAGFRKLRSVADQEPLDEEDRRRLLELGFTLFSEAESLIWQDVQSARTEDGDFEGAEDLIVLSDEDARTLREIAEEQEADLALIEELGWVEDVSGPEGIVSTDFEDYSL